MNKEIKDILPPAPFEWMKNDPKKFNWFEGDSIFLVATMVKNNKTGEEKYEFDTVQTDCDGEGMSLFYAGTDNIYDAWDWEDFDYFVLLSGTMPTYNQIISTQKQEGEE